MSNVNATSKVSTSVRDQTATMSNPSLPLVKAQNKGDVGGSKLHVLTSVAKMIRDAKEKKKMAVTRSKKSTITATWLKKYRLFKKFVLKEKHAGVPLTLDTAEYPGLGSWVATQRQCYRNYVKEKQNLAAPSRHRMCKRRLFLLKKAGFQWQGTADTIEFVTNVARAKIFNLFFHHPDHVDNQAFPNLSSWTHKMQKQGSRASSWKRAMLRDAGVLTA